MLQRHLQSWPRPRPRPRVVVLGVAAAEGVVQHVAQMKAYPVQLQYSDAAGRL